MLALLLLACGGEDVETGETGDTGREVIQESRFYCDEVEYNEVVREEGWTVTGASTLLNVQLCEESEDLGTLYTATTSWVWYEDLEFLVGSCSDPDRIYVVFWI